MVQPWSGALMFPHRSPCICQAHQQVQGIAEVPRHKHGQISALSVSDWRRGLHGEPGECEWPLAVCGWIGGPHADSWGLPEQHWHLWLCCTNRRVKHQRNVGWELCIFIMLHHWLLSPTSPGWTFLSVCNFVQTCDVNRLQLKYCNWCQLYLPAATCYLFIIVIISWITVMFLFMFYLTFFLRWKYTWWKRNSVREH